MTQPTWAEEIQRHKDIWDNQFIRKNQYECKLFLYSKSKELIKVVSYDDFEYNPYSKLYKALFDTPNEYYLTLYRLFPYQNWPSTRKISYIEVFSVGNKFIARHYVRDCSTGHYDDFGQFTPDSGLSPLVGYEYDKDKDHLIKQQQVASKPVLDWNRIVRDSMFSGHQSRPKSIGEMYLKYKR